ncbi:diguanylate cyclase [Deinococcus maricopensis]|uniref:Diguanylate cyclase n=1 Tax=Deinococcus maricopensis (strain DSM 21211 / LMG 22137 / NRRL B-23946 / LB-34) TaxID=709986 RepID=E8U7H1_DEIML|nr:diguanylate cyclase [Deinococcus maricopensis]ADV67010.1 diguanylate cyclase [Deinococcus maricopensis DSM 21211]
MRLSTYILRTLALVWGVIGLLGLSTMLGVQRVQRDVRVVEHLRAQDKQVEILLKRVVDLETGVRGYVITGDASFLEPFNAARATLQQELRTLDGLLAASDQPAPIRADERADVQRAAAVLRRWLDESAQPDINERRRTTGRVVGRAVLGKQYIDQVRVILADLQDEIQRDLTVRQVSMDATLGAVRTATVIGLPVAVLLSILIGLILARRLAMTFGTLETVTNRLAAGHLDERVPQLRLHEAQALAQDFNHMADTLQATQRDLHERNASLSTQNALIERANTDSAHLAALSDNLQACYTLDEGYAVLQQAMPHLFPGWSGVISVISASRNLMDVRVSWGNDQWRTHDPVSSPDQCWALRRGAAYTREHPMSMACIQQAPDHQHPYLCLPLVAQGDAVGILRLGSDHADLPVDEQRRVRSFADVVAKQVALAIANLQLRDTLHNQSIRDPLTRLFNRRYLEETLARELRRSERSSVPVSVLAVDIDHFKRFNDTFGHDGGDATLKAVADAMTAHFRAEDVVCRYGGEEFMVVLLDTPHADALARAEGLRRTVRELHVTHAGASLGTISVSVGVATSERGQVTGHQLVAQADAALYQAKRAGRDRVVSAAQPPEQPS